MALDDGALELRIGRRSPRLDALLESSGNTIGAIISAENPRSRPLSATQNAARTARLAARLDAVRSTRIDGENRAPDGRFREAAYLVLGIDEPEALELARDFQQAAIVVVELGRAARLVAT